MSPTFSAARSFGGAFVVTEIKIIALAELCEKVSEGRVSIDLGFSDNTTISSENASDLLKDPLTRLYMVRDLSIGSLGSKIRVRVRPWGSGSCEASYEIRGADTETGPALKERLDAEVLDMRRAYSFLYPQPFWFGYLAWVATALLLGFGAFVGWAKVFPLDDRWAGTAMICSFAIGAAVAAAINVGKRYLFPPLIFDFGKGAQLAKQRSTARMILLTSVILAVAVRFAYSKLFD
ncbi:MAG: hypothetical protein QOC72_1781 [Methylobacteriaceae bacterium]|nr:hypothetical protein [Methylobacteriaceae bacterium]